MRKIIYSMKSGCVMALDQDKALANFVYAATMLKKLPRSGYAYLGTGKESIADHSYGAVVIAFVLGQMAGADIARITLLGLFHDLHEAATGDFNYVNHRYDACDALKAIRDISRGALFSGLLEDLWREFENRETMESRLANDADQLDMICSLRRELANGNQFAGEWLKSAVKRLLTAEGKQLCAAIMATDPASWWYEQVDPEWWVNHKKKNRRTINYARGVFQTRQRLSIAVYRPVHCLDFGRVVFMACGHDKSGCA